MAEMAQGNPLQAQAPAPGASPTDDMQDAAPTPEFRICIELYEDGTIKVGEDKEGQESESPESTEDAGMQTVDNLPAALKIAKQMLEDHQNTSGGMNPFDIGANKVLNPGANKGAPQIGMPQ
jgi:hypothetical protein